ncbi:CapA family protein [Parabacteroides sp. PF5-6]|uniref:CapA family protein n=1 Tax=Parabacteroides sp. PF5-6 TaxID=1742403 RepID=UPI0024069FB0|nr:CapA family protein [Parabacteroides sp. PF5-6]MDF9830912.1 poly-gamma-glutamate capsule biosynthesis protein CapA/YwtB (metallophosphatase superfamily) [Parabacteroides sp. PF5-6]
MRQLKYILPVSLLLIFLLWVGIRGGKSGEAVPQDEVIEEAVAVPDTLRLLFAGDVMVHATQYESAWQEGGDSTYNFNPPFTYIQDLIRSADLSIANFEVALGGKPYSGYPLFSSPPEIVDALKDAGFDLLFTANNHAADKGRKGIEGTIEYMRALDLLHTGSFIDSTDRADHYPLLVERNHIRLAFLNYTYGTNGMPVRKPNIINLTDTVQIRADLAKARLSQPDYIITCMHWGYEYHEKEHAEQRRLARFLAENGTQLIIGSHPHVVQPYDEIVTHAGDTVPVIYSLGNLISNQQWRRADGGILFEVILVKNEGQTARISSAYEPFWVNRFNEETQSIYRIIPVNDYRRHAERYDLDDEQRRKINLFDEDTRATLPTLPFSDFYLY